MNSDIFKSNWPHFTDKMIDNVTNVLKSGKVNQWTGNKVTEFEKKFSQYFGINYSVAVMNGSVAIELCLKALDIKEGDEIIVTPRTFIASATSIILCGGKCVFVDVDHDSQNITLENIKKAKTDKTKAVILVHLAGWPCEVQEIVDWCHQNNIYVIEDCAQCHGAKYNNKYVGTFGDINAWSFCQDKIITTGGEGGMVTTNDKNLYLKAWSYKDHGKNQDKIFGEKSEKGFFKWVHDTVGTNWRMTEMQASIGIDALDLLENWVNIRRRNAHILNNILKNNPNVRLTIPNDNIYHAYYKYYIFLKESCTKSRDQILREINNQNIPCFQGACGEIYKEKAFGENNYSFPITQELSKTCLMFCVDPSYSEEVINIMGNKINEIIF